MTNKLRSMRAFKSAPPYSIPAVSRIEQVLIDNFMITSDFESIACGTINWKRYKMAHLVNCILYITFLRALLYFVYYKDPAWQDLLGDYCWSLGVGGDFLQFWLLAFSVFGLCLRLVLIEHERLNKLDFVSDLAIFKRPNMRIEQTTLTAKNFVRFKILSQSALGLMRGFRVFIYSTVIPIHTLGAIKAYEQRQSLPLLAYYCFWLVMLLIWLHYACLATTCPPCMYYLAATYIKMRYKQLNKSAKQLLVVSDYLQGSNQLLQFIREHDEITQRVFNYNRPVKYILFCFDYMSAPIASISAFVPVYAQFSSPYDAAVFFAIACQLLFVSIFFASVTGGVHLQVSACTIRSAGQ